MSSDRLREAADLYDRTASESDEDAAIAALLRAVAVPITDWSDPAVEGWIDMVTAAALALTDVILGVNDE